ncbi:hypothetical protein [Acinetobacter sp. TGL-Y2]|uniref:hypothetical protein n=1 Tax=Acinetobacter sp. TGL-Y2 TaxID=1407071 RepID=UPI0012377114|nr:hypothetical protein [Acinetobacter sp. TGL-Y2]
MDNIDLNFWSTITLAIFAFLVTTIGVYYTRNSYLITLKSFEKVKSRSEKAKHYYQEYINKPPSITPSPFLKKIDSDDLNENVNLPTEFTDFLIKNHPNQYFHYVSRLTKSHKYFEIITVSGVTTLKSNINYIGLRQLGYFLLYVLFAMFATFLVLYFPQIINSFSIDNFWGILYLLIIAIILFLALMFMCLFKTTDLSETRFLINELEKHSTNNSD